MRRSSREDLGGGDVQIDLPDRAGGARACMRGLADRRATPCATARFLPTRITAALLCDPRIPEQWRTSCLQAVATEEDLLACGVQDEASAAAGGCPVRNGPSP
jgi:hypothetical protein